MVATTRSATWPPRHSDPSVPGSGRGAGRLRVGMSSDWMLQACPYRSNTRDTLAYNWLVNHSRMAAGSRVTVRLPHVRSNACENVFTTDSPDISIPKIVQPAAFTMLA